MIVRSPFRVLWAVVLSLMYRELKSRFNATPWGLVSTFTKPASRVIMFTFLLGAHGARALPGIEFPMFLLLGFVPYHFFLQCFNQMNAIDSSEQLLVYKQVKPLNVVLSRVMVEFAIHYSSFLIMLVLLFWWGLDIVPVDPIEAMLVICMMTAFSFGVAVSISIIAYLQPLSSVVFKMIRRLLFWFSCLMYPMSMVPDALRPYVLMNPLVHFLELLRGSWFYAYPDSGASWTFATISTVSSLFIASVLFRRYRRSLPRG